MATITRIVPTLARRWTWGDLKAALSSEVVQIHEPTFAIPVQAKLGETPPPYIDRGEEHILFPLAKTSHHYSLDIAPDFNFGLEVWMNSSNEFMDELDELQEFGVRDRKRPLSEEFCQQLANIWKQCGFSITVASGARAYRNGLLKALLLAIADHFSGYVIVYDSDQWQNFPTGVYSAEEFRAAEPKLRYD